MSDNKNTFWFCHVDLSCLRSHCVHHNIRVSGDIQVVNQVHVYYSFFSLPKDIFNVIIPFLSLLDIYRMTLVAKREAIGEMWKSELIQRKSLK